MSLNKEYLGHLLRIIDDRFGQTPPDWFLGWEQEYSKYIKSEDIALGLALLFPGFYFNKSGTKISSNGGCPIRGARSFGGEAAPSRCDWAKLTGDVCEFSHLLREAFALPMITTAKDHVWPYALGGNTVDANKVILCRWHNGMIKGADNSYFEYLTTHHGDQHHTQWIDDSLSIMYTLMKGESFR